MGSKKSSSTSTTTAKHKQDPQYGTLLKGSDSWLKQGGFDKNYGGSEGFDPIADMNQKQLGALDQSFAGGGRLQDLYSDQGFQSLQDVLGRYDPNKTGVLDAMGYANEQSQFDFETGQMGNIRQGAQGAGQFGSSRHGIAEGLARGRLAQGQNAVNANMMYQDQQAWNTNRQGALNNLSAIGQGLNAGNQQQMNAGNILQGQEQQELMGQLEKWAYENNVPMQDLMAYKTLISGDMGGKTTSKTESSGGGGLGAAIGTVGGAALGAWAGNPMLGAAIGGQAGGQL